MNNAMTVEDVQNLREQLQRVRAKSLEASRRNDFRLVARLTGETARLNRLIQAQEDFAGFSPKSLAVVDALADFEDAGHFDFPEEQLGEQLAGASDWQEAA
jgi:hypothetical protein